LAADRQRNPMPENLIGRRRNRPTVDLSQSELALMVGASRQAVNKVLQ
jgi:DNA-binding XRE family transcriptional regulator